MEGVGIPDQGGGTEAGPQALGQMGHSLRDNGLGQQVIQDNTCLLKVLATILPCFCLPVSIRGQKEAAFAGQPIPQWPSLYQMTGGGTGGMGRQVPPNSRCRPPAPA